MKGREGGRKGGREGGREGGRIEGEREGGYMGDREKGREKVNKREGGLVCCHSCEGTCLYLLLGGHSGKYSNIQKQRIKLLPAS